MTDSNVGRILRYMNRATDCSFCSNVLPFAPESDEPACSDCQTRYHEMAERLRSLNGGYGVADETLIAQDALNSLREGRVYAGFWNI